MKKSDSSFKTEAEKWWIDLPRGKETNHYLSLINYSYLNGPVTTSMVYDMYRLKNRIEALNEL